MGGGIRDGLQGSSLKPFLHCCREGCGMSVSKYKPVEGYYDDEYKQGELLDLSVFPDDVRDAADDNWGEPIFMEHDFTVEEMLDMSTEGEIQMNLTNIDCVGQDDLCKNDT